MVITLIDVLIKYQVIDLNKLLLKIYPKLGLLPQEGVMLLHFLSFYQQNQQKSFKISLLALKNKTGLSEAEIKKLITELEKKEFIDVTLNAAPSGKREEYYDVSRTITKIDQFLLKEKRAIVEKQTSQSLEEVVVFFQNELQRELTPVELSLLNQNKYAFGKEDYETAIKGLPKNEKISIKNCIDFLETKKIMSQEVDEKDVQSIKDFLSKLSK